MEADASTLDMPSDCCYFVEKAAAAGAAPAFQYFDSIFHHFAVVTQNLGQTHLCLLFRPVGFCFSKILRLCCSSHHKIRLSYCREKAFVATLCRTAEYAANPFPASAGIKGITH